MRILNDFDKWLIEDNNYPKESHYASNVYGCRRQQYYQWTGEKESNPNTPGSILKMKFGYATEDIFEKFLNYCIDNKKPINGKLLDSYVAGWKASYVIPGLKKVITCKLDFVLKFVDGKEMAVEVKSMFGRGITKIAKSQEPKKSYLDQIYVYIHLTPFKHFIHPYFGRDNGYRTEFEVIEHEDGIETIYTTLEGKERKRVYEYDFDLLINRLVEVEKAVEQKQAPDRDFLTAIKNGQIRDNGYQHNRAMYTSAWQCNYCNYRDLCWKEELCKYTNSNNSDEFIRRGPFEENN